MRANQLRLWFSSMACVLVCAHRRIGLAGTQFAMPSAFPYQAEYRAAHAAAGN